MYKTKSSLRFPDLAESSTTFLAMSLWTLTFRLPSYLLWHRLPRGEVTSPFRFSVRFKLWSCNAPFDL